MYPKGMGLENSEHTLEQDIAKNEIKVRVVKIRSHISYQFLFQGMVRRVITPKKMVKTYHTLDNRDCLEHCINERHGQQEVCNGEERGASVILIVDDGVTNHYDV